MQARRQSECPGSRLETRLTQLDLMLGRAQLRGQEVVDRAFLLGAMLVGVILAASVVKMLVQRRLNPSR